MAVILEAARRAGDDVNRIARIGVVVLLVAVVPLEVVDGRRPEVVVLVPGDVQVDARLVEELLQAVVSAVVVVVVVVTLFIGLGERLQRWTVLLWASLSFDAVVVVVLVVVLVVILLMIMILVVLMVFIVLMVRVRLTTTNMRVLITIIMVMVMVVVVMVMVLLRRPLPQPLSQLLPLLHRRRTVHQLQTVEGPMAEDDDEGSLCAVLLPIRPLQVGLQPLVLVADLLVAKLQKVVELGAEHDYMGGADVQAVVVVVQSLTEGAVVVVVVLRPAEHRKAGVVVAEVAVPLVVSSAGHVGDASGNWLQCSHEAVAAFAIILKFLKKKMFFSFKKTK